MMKNFTVLLLTIVVILFVGFSQVSAQSDMDKLLETGISDANKLIKGYMDPFMKGFGAALGGGWYHTAKPHKTFGFDIMATVNLAYVPDEDMFYNINESLENTRLLEESGGAPTVFGPDETPTYEFSYYDETTDMTLTQTFQGPPGIGMKDEIGFNAAPVPMAQIGIGIVKNTDIKVRWTPEIDMGDGKFKLLGFGVMHDVKQHIPGLKNLPFDLSAFIGFTDIKTTVDLEDHYVDTDNRGAFDVSTWTFQGIISKKFSILTAYAGLGFNKVKSDLKMIGKYDVGAGGEPIEDPVNLAFKSGGARLTTGMRLKLAILTLHADYTVQKYDVLTLGIGFSFR